MIEEIERVKNLGGFNNFEWDEEVESFKKLNVIFGENGSGKTSFSNIFRLFSEHCDNQKIWGKIKSEDSEVEILHDGSSISYQQGSREKNIYVFNEHFINEHVYDGSSSNLSEFDSSVTTKEQLKNPEINALDEKIKKKKDKLDKLQDFIKRLERKFDETHEKLSDELNNEIKGTRFPSKVNLQRVVEKPNFLDGLKDSENLRENLDNQFDLYHSSVNESKLKESIHKLQGVEIKDKLQAPLEDIQSLLNETIEVDSGIEQKIEQLKHEIDFSDGLVGWFEKGYNILKLRHQKVEDEVQCPLCNSNLQKRRSEDLVNSYSSFFNQDFQELQKELREKKASLKSLVEKIDKNSKYISVIREVCNDHSEVIEEGLKPQEDSELKDRLKERLKTLEKTLDKKLKDVTQEFEDSNIGELIKEAEKLLAKYSDSMKIITDNVSSIYDTLKDLDGKKEKFKKEARNIIKKLTYAKFNSLTLEDYNEDLLTNDINNMEDNLDVARSFYEEKTELKGKLEDLNAEKRAKIAELKDESQYVNEFLKRLGIHHLIIDKKDANNQNIEVQYESGEATDNFEYSLSSGEKTTLAFAYFLSKIKYEVEMSDSSALSDVTVVLDDPISSLDQNRLFSTANLIQRNFIGGKDTGNLKVSQLFILSHNLQFLKFLNNVAYIQGSKRGDFMISNKDPGIKIENLPNSLNAYQTQYFHKLIDIIRYVEGEYSYEEAKKFLPNYVRNVMETFLSFKFVRLKKGSSRDKYQAPSLGKLIRKMENYKTNGQLSAILEDKEKVGNINSSNFVKKLRNVKRLTDVESHGNVQNATGVHWVTQDKLDRLAEDTLDIIEFLDEIHLTQTKEKAS